MNFNSTDFKNLEVGKELYMVRYSQSPAPDYKIVMFKSYDEHKGSLEYSYMKDEKELSKKTNKQKAMYRFFVDKDEMAKSLFDCFKKRGLNEIPEDYHSLMNDSQDNRPEIWI